MNNVFVQCQKKEDLNKRYTEIKASGYYYKCKSCDGTGLDNYSTYKDLTLWDGQLLCKVCDGMGIFDWVENATCGIETILEEGVSNDYNQN